MKSNIKNNLKSLMEMSGGGDVVNQMMMILDLPDEQFNQVYPNFKSQLEKMMYNADIQHELINTARANPITEEDKKQAKEAMNSFFEEINQDENLSENKKEMLNILLNSSIKMTFDIVENPRERIIVKVQKINNDAILPKYAHPTDAGADIFAVEEITIEPHKTEIVKTGIKVAIPGGYEIQIRPRSGLSLKTPLRIPNAPGTIDSDYRGEIGIIMENIGDESYTIKKGDKIAQMIISPVPMIIWEETDTLEETSRGEGGYGSTDKS